MTNLQPMSCRLDEVIESADRKSQLLLAVTEHRRRRERIGLRLASLAATAAAVLIVAAVLFATQRTELLASAAALSLGACMIHSVMPFRADRATTQSIDAGATKFLQLFDRARQLRAAEDDAEFARKSREISDEHDLLSQQCDALIHHFVDRLRSHALVTPQERDKPSRYRQHARIVPRERQTSLSLDGGQTYPARLINVSMTGASLAVAASLPVQADVTVGRTKARVIRSHQNGVAVEFQHFLSPRIFNEDLIL